MIYILAMYRGCHGRDRARINPTNDVSSNPAHVLDTTLCDKVCP